MRNKKDFIVSVIQFLSSCMTSRTNLILRSTVLLEFDQRQSARIDRCQMAYLCEDNKNALVCVQTTTVKNLEKEKV